jgi:hypothetical protein
VGASESPATILLRSGNTESTPFISSYQYGSPVSRV